MTTFSIQLHQAIDGTCFPTKQLADEHSLTVRQTALDMFRIIVNSIVDNDENTKYIIEDVLKEKDKLKILFV